MKIMKTIFAITALFLCAPLSAMKKTKIQPCERSAGHLDTADFLPVNTGSSSSAGEDPSSEDLSSEPTSPNSSGDISAPVASSSTHVDPNPPTLAYLRLSLSLLKQVMPSQLSPDERLLIPTLEQWVAELEKSKPEHCTIQPLQNKCAPWFAEQARRKQLQSEAHAQHALEQAKLVVADLKVVAARATTMQQPIICPQCDFLETKCALCRAGVKKPALALPLSVFSDNSSSVSDENFQPQHQQYQRSQTVVLDLDAQPSENPSSSRGSGSLQGWERQPLAPVGVNTLAAALQKMKSSPSSADSAGGTAAPHGSFA